ncbi:MAG: glycine cleavage system protein GcvH [Caldiserica bacterium]|nr:glycine cleavage system protein GcvH [Caldisericia bacterium]RLD12825.1 MAG: glycine cleavage system protein GcvH [Caldisericota bacterium]HDH63132.1 glycine cleavage system protein GcvH [Bacillota bacterium]
MAKVVEGLYYAKTDEWAKVEGDTATVGITDYAQDQLGDIVYVEEAEVGKKVKKGEAVISIESVKTAADIHAPVSGEIIEVNKEVVDNPSIVNEDPFGKGWLFKIKMENKEDLNDLMDAKGYSEYRK